MRNLVLRTFQKTCPWRDLLEVTEWWAACVLQLLGRHSRFRIYSTLILNGFKITRQKKKSPDDWLLGKGGSFTGTGHPFPRGNNWLEMRGWVSWMEHSLSLSSISPFSPGPAGRGICSLPHPFPPSTSTVGGVEGEGVRVIISSVISCPFHPYLL